MSLRSDRIQSSREVEGPLTLSGCWLFSSFISMSPSAHRAMFLSWVSQHFSWSWLCTLDGTGSSIRLSVIDLSQCIPFPGCRDCFWGWASHSPKFTEMQKDNSQALEEKCPFLLKKSSENVSFLSLEHVVWGCEGGCSHSHFVAMRQCPVQGTAMFERDERLTDTRSLVILLVSQQLPKALLQLF